MLTGSILVDAEFGRVNQSFVPALPPDAHINRRLVFLRQPLLEEVFPSIKRGNRVHVDPFQRRQGLHNLRANLHLRQIALCVLVFGVNPCSRLWTLCILQPAVRVFDFSAVVIVSNRMHCGDRRSSQHNAIATLNRSRLPLQGEDKAENKRGENHPAPSGKQIAFLHVVFLSKRGWGRCASRQQTPS